MSAYSRLPKKLFRTRSEIFITQSKDVYGVEIRLDKIREIFTSNPHVSTALTNSSKLKLVDLGGNNGYFSFELISSGIISSATVIDTNPLFLEEGARIAKLIGCNDEIQFINREVNLDFVKTQLEPVDIVLINNLLHHAGYLFDNDIVSKIGWGNYLVEFLNSIYEKSNIVVLGLGLKRSLPLYWQQPKFTRIGDNRYWEISQLIGKTQWKVCHYSFVDNIDKVLASDLPRWQMLIGRVLEPLLKFIFMLRAWLEEKSRIKLRPKFLDQKKFYVILVLAK